MNALPHIRYLQRREIDTVRWDDCINQSRNGLIYARSFYLDQMARNWDALVLDDYKAVMPLTWNKKWGITYLYQPPLTPQLGIFSPASLSAELIKSFLQETERRFRFGEIFLNFHNAHPNLKFFTNYILDLRSSYEALCRQYKKDLQKNLKKAAALPLRYGDISAPEEVISLYRKHYAQKTPHVRESDYQHFENVCRAAQKQSSLILRGVFLQSKAGTKNHTGTKDLSGPKDLPEDHLLAAALLLKNNPRIGPLFLSPASAAKPLFTAPVRGAGSQLSISPASPGKTDRIFLLMSVCPPEGRKMEANHFLIDQLIKEFSGTDTTLDFEGSEIPGVAHFYNNFGALNQPFFFYRFNHLPWPLRLFK